MRKLTSVFIALFLVITTYAQTPISYSNVEKKEGMSATELFRNAKLWVTSTFVSANIITDMSDDNILVIKPNHLYDAMSAHHKLDYVLTIECRDGRYKWTINQIVYSCRWMTNPREFDFGLLNDAECTNAYASFFGKERCKKYWKLAQEEAQKLQIALIKSLDESMGKSEKANDNW